ncbi:hypothetical protein [Maritimibacter sp. UBA3975]|uniref:hypothetical protein n=1 Tax=Maritimibacter sp. UBA3975 TaxID=1946833 RepID=UPI000C0918CA|nr:hypothetical protein [Maritimibacter sp. UBA3975]MAM60860.1 hypothetical protein [Maritimibacter sp.]|tara:strand:+ start:13366 stop:13746 length:381 start_codon:yes stop_codon:yes gene_type:complete
MTTLAAKVTAAFDKIAAARPQAIQTATIRKTAVSGGGPSDTSGGTATPTDYSVRVAVFSIPLPRVGYTLIDGTNIQATDYQVVVESFAVELEPGDKIIVTQGMLRVVDPGAIAPGGTVLAYDAVAR